MKKYITNLYGQSIHSTAMIAQHMITDIAKKQEYSEIAIPAYDLKHDTDVEKVKRIEGMLAQVSSDSMAVVQLPSWNGIAFDEVFIKLLRNRVKKLVVFVHDFVPLMFENNYYLFERYLEAYNLADLAVLPSKKMEVLLREKGLDIPVIIQNIWDHTTSINLENTPVFHRKIKFAGNIRRFPFVQEWKQDIPLEVYSNGEELHNEHVKLLGWKNDDQLLRELNEGGFGLVWSENIENQSEREYSEMNVSFKFSTYLSAGIPIIVNKGLAKQDFVEKYQIGFVAETLDEAVDRVNSMSIEEYNQMVSRVHDISSMIREGFFTQMLLVDIQRNLYLEEDKYDNL